MGEKDIDQEKNSQGINTHMGCAKKKNWKNGS